MRTKTQSGRDLKDNSGKHPQKHDDWMEAKKVGRPKQRYVYDNGFGWEWHRPKTLEESIGQGHWEKLDTTA